MTGPAATVDITSDERQSRRNTETMAAILQAAAEYDNPQ